MLVVCPECEQKVSDRADACPHCGLPIARHFAAEAEKKKLEESRASRREVGAVDCVECEARGFRTWTEKGGDGVAQSVFAWCAACEHSGRVVLCRSSAGFFAVPHVVLADFLAGKIDEGANGVHAFGPSPPIGHRYSDPGERVKDK